MSSRFHRIHAWWRGRLAAVVACGVVLATVAACGVVLATVASPAGAGVAQAASYPLLSRASGSFANITVTQTRVWVFTSARSGVPGSIVELSPATGSQIGTVRERQPGQTPWVVAVYQNHPWTTAVPADGDPVLTEVSASGVFMHSVKLASVFTPIGPIAGAAALAGSNLWAATSPSSGAPTGLTQVSASSGARTGFVHWPRALRGFFPVGMAVSGGQIWMTDGACRVARVTTSSGQSSIFRLPQGDCGIGSVPALISAVGGHIWVATNNTSVANDGSVAELNAGNGHLIRLISGRAYGWNLPSFVVAGPDLWVTSQTGGFGGKGSVTELSASTGRLVHFYGARKYHFDHPFAIAAWGSHVWALNAHSVTKL